MSKAKGILRLYFAKTEEIKMREKKLEVDVFSSLEINRVKYVSHAFQC